MKKISGFFHRVPAFLAIGLLLAGCTTTSSHIPLGTPTVRSQVSPYAVRIYNTPPAVYEEVAIVDTSSLNSIALSEQAHQDVVIQRLKEEAARLGANGVILSSVTRPSMGYPVPVHSTSTGTRPPGSVIGASPVGIGVGSAHGVIPSTVPFATGSGIAIFVPMNSGAVSLLEEQQLEQLQMLKELRDEGIIAVTEYEKRRRAIIDSVAVSTNP